MRHLPTILLSRCPRRPNGNWPTARSWLGGAPRLGAASWPRDGSGEPLHFVAQIDLADLRATARRSHPTSLTRSGCSS
ncbi:DUF1963 domain-containing protein [Bradyrhizobium sp. WSM 1704]|uniref:DUF1963 domain-containing protein n=1 Tax=Bradyrhizobium semiaridum TaxID=2821404 RepID=UPI001CE315E3|nr:DUF1963 domain-containing protein [Bradyrhizobium semiaridum]